ncbi:MAG: AMP-binding protein [Acidobacteriota bacterium]
METVPNAAWALLAPNLARHPDKPAYRCGDAVLTYAELASAAARAGAMLAAWGVSPGDRVACILPDSLSLPVLLLGAMWIGACPVPLATSLRPEDHARILADAGVRLLVATPDHRASAVPGVRRLPWPHDGFCGPGGLEGFGDDLPPFVPAASDLAYMLYTSGPTGQPLGVPHRHSDLLRPAETLGELLGLTEDDVLFSASKMPFAYGLIASLGLALGRGATAVLFPGTPGPFELAELIGHCRPSVFFAVPTVYNLLLRTLSPEHPLPSVRLFCSAGEALPAATFLAWQELAGREICEGLGSAEAGNLFLANHPGQGVPGAAGRLVPGYEAHLVDEAGCDVAEGQPGRLLLRGAGTAPFYWNLPELSRETMLPGGWLRTGDLFVATGGLFVHQGRGDDMLKVGGRFVAPLEVEAVLLAHPDVAQCAVTGCRVEGLERPLAVIVARDGAAGGPGLAGELRRYLRQRLPEEMCPARMRFVAALPRTDAGAIDRRALREDD